MYTDEPLFSDEEGYVIDQKTLDFSSKMYQDKLDQQLEVIRFLYTKANIILISNSMLAILMSTALTHDPVSHTLFLIFALFGITISTGSAIVAVGFTRYKSGMGTVTIYKYTLGTRPSLEMRYRWFLTQKDNIIFNKKILERKQLWILTSLLSFLFGLVVLILYIIISIYY